MIGLVILIVTLWTIGGVVSVSGYKGWHRTEFLVEAPVFWDQVLIFFMYPFMWLYATAYTLGQKVKRARGKG